ncbi:MAG: hypothetical protein LUQ66_10565 [Methanoregula sp.]|nr:hypothetical protein [Methanoregula sp.]
MARDNHKPVFGGTYRDTGYIFGNSAYTCCHNCTRREDCPPEAEGKKCTRKQHICTSCTRWNEQGCRHFVLDWEILKI